MEAPLTTCHCQVVNEAGRATISLLSRTLYNHCFFPGIFRSGKGFVPGRIGRRLSRKECAMLTSCASLNHNKLSIFTINKYQVDSGKQLLSRASSYFSRCSHRPSWCLRTVATCFHERMECRLWLFLYVYMDPSVLKVPCIHQFPSGKQYHSHGSKLQALPYTCMCWTSALRTDSRTTIRGCKSASSGRSVFHSTGATRSTIFLQSFIQTKNTNISYILIKSKCISSPILLH